MSAGARGIIVASALLTAVGVLPPHWHLPVGIVAWLLIRFGTGDVHRTFGRPLRWVQGLLLLCLLGALFGPGDTRTLGFGWSRSGALAGSTMLVRAFALLALTSFAASVVPLRRWSAGIRIPVVRTLIEVVVVASNLVPVQTRALTAASSTLSERLPGLRRLPRRLWLLAVHGALRAAMLAESVAFDMAIASHNTPERRRESP